MLPASSLRWETADATSGDTIGIGNGYVSSLSPGPCPAPADTIVQLTASKSPVTAPTLIGLPVQDATNALVNLDLKPFIAGPMLSVAADAKDGMIQSQRPDPGSQVAGNSSVLVRKSVRRRRF